MCQGGISYPILFPISQAQGDMTVVFLSPPQFLSFGIMCEFMGQESLVHLIERFGKVKDDDISLERVVKVFCHFICQLGELTDTRVSCSKPVLEWG